MSSKFTFLTLVLAILSLKIYKAQNSTTSIPSNNNNSFSFSFTSSNVGYTPLNGGTNITLTPDQSTGYPDAMDEGWANNIPIGFTFKYVGVERTTINVSSNGFAYFGNSLLTVSGDNNLMSGPMEYQSSSRPILAPLWDDHKVMGSISYKTSGSAPNRVFTIEWKDVKWRYNANAAGISFQLKLYETSNEIEFVYNREPGNLSSGATASIGITNSATGNGNFISLSNTSSNPNHSSSVEYKSLSNKPQTGQRYKFKPMLCHEVSNLKASNITNGNATISWTNHGSGSEFEYVLGTNSTIPSNNAGATAVNGTEVNLNNLQSDELYFIHVRKKCGINEFSHWKTLSFSTLENDDPCGAKELVGNNSITVNTAKAVLNNGTDPALNCSNPNNTVWFKYTATANGKKGLILTTPQTGNYLNGWVQVYKASGTCPNLTLTEVNPNECVGMFGQTSGDLDTLNTPDLIAGQTYYIMVDGHSNDVGTFTIKLCNPQGPQHCATNFSPSNNSSNVPGLTTGVVLSWTDIPFADSYDVYVGTTPQLLNKVATVNTGLYMLHNLNYNSTYYWSIVPKNSIGTLTQCLSTNVNQFTTSNASTNCVPLYQSNNQGNKLGMVWFMGEVNELMNTGNLNCSNMFNGYYDYSNDIGTNKVIFANGQSYSLILKSMMNSNSLVSIWLDKNDNGIYENNERLLNNYKLAENTKQMVSFTIPANAITGSGVRTLRIRTIKDMGNNNATDPCMQYPSGTTHDYPVVITDQTMADKTILSASGGTFTNLSDVKIDEVVNNKVTNLNIIDKNCKIACKINANGNELGLVQSTVYTHGTTSTLRKFQQRKYLSRNISIKFENEPTTPVTVIAYITQEEIDQLFRDANPNNGDAKKLEELGIMFVPQSECKDKIGDNDDMELITPNGYGRDLNGYYLSFQLKESGSIYIGSNSARAHINFVDFTATRNDKVNDLQWQSAFEYKTKTFVIERSNDYGKTWIEIGTRKAARNSNINRTYKFTDENPEIGGFNLYRIKLLTQDGSVVYSNIQRVGNTYQLEMTVFPNPAREYVKVEIVEPKVKTGFIHITDKAGRIFQKQNLTLDPNTNTVITVDITKLLPGEYYVEGMFGGYKYVRRFTKLKD